MASAPYVAIPTTPPGWSLKTDVAGVFYQPTVAGAKPAIPAAPAGYQLTVTAFGNLRFTGGAPSAVLPSVSAAASSPATASASMSAAAGSAGADLLVPAAIFAVGWYVFRKPWIAAGAAGAYWYWKSQTP